LTLSDLSPRRRQVHDLWWQLLWTQGNPSTQRIADDLEISVPSVSAALRDLRHMGVVPERPTGSYLVPASWLLEKFCDDYPMAVELREGGMEPSQGSKSKGEGEAKTENEEDDFFPVRLSAKDVGYPGAADEDKDALIADLREEIDSLKRLLEWTTHTPSTDLQGGTFSLACSDLHYTNQGHLLHTAINLEEKLLEMLDRFQPRRFQGIVNGDVIQGRGIFRNQHLDNLLAKTEDQIKAAVYRFWELDQRIAEKFPKMDREWCLTQGNHDYSKGESTCLPFTWGCKQFGVPMSFVGYEHIINLADEGTHNALALHGYGNSAFSSSSNKLIFETLKRIVGYTNKGYAGEKAIRRVIHSHTHWLNVNVQHAEGLSIDVTGGLHRNDRANLGLNNRPCGWIGYVSPPKSDEIIEPIEITPSRRIHRAEIDDPDLTEKNREDAVRCIRAFRERALELGLIKETTGEAA
jgi:hypothetical protein